MSEIAEEKVCQLATPEQREHIVKVWSAILEVLAEKRVFLSSPTISEDSVSWVIKRVDPKEWSNRPDLIDVGELKFHSLPNSDCKKFQIVEYFDGSSVMPLPLLWVNPLQKTLENSGYVDWGIIDLLVC